MTLIQIMNILRYMPKDSDEYIKAMSEFSDGVLNNRFIESPVYHLSELVKSIDFDTEELNRIFKKKYFQEYKTDWEDDNNEESDS